MNEGRAPREIPKPGETLAGKYRIERSIAEGGMGVVVEATHLQLEERVAIKFLKPEVLGGDDASSREVVTRFLREARAAIRIRSEHVVRVFDVSTLETGAPYIVMELLEGKDLDDLVAARGPLPVTEAVDHVLQACEALGEAHALGIVHRDLKPANLFLTRTAAGVPIVKVLDFGISKLGSAAGEDMSMTSTQAVMGSPLYMSPEQMRSTRDTDARSDIWAMGVILYELLSGKPPFSGETMTQVCAAILQDSPPPLGSTRKDVPPGLERVVLKCLEKRPQDRYATIADLAAALAPFASLVGQEAARRTSRSASFASSGKLALGSSPDLKSEPTSVPALASTHPPKESGAGATSTAWGDENRGARKSKTPIVLAALALVAIVGVGAFALRGSASTATAPPPPATTPTAATPTSTSTSTPTPTPTSTSTSTEPSPSPSTSTSPKPVAKKVSPPPAPKPTAPPPKASWNERK